MSISERILTVEQMTHCERTSERLGVSLWQLMNNAGSELARTVKNKTDGSLKKPLVILAGKGNNGGDGFVAAKRLWESCGISSDIILCCGEPDTELSKKAFGLLPKEIKVLRFGKDNDNDVLSAVKSGDIIIDCIFGTGFKGRLRENILPIFKACMANEKAYKIACDIPSGCNADNGDADRLSFKADLTVSFHKCKSGLLLSPARYYTGQLCTADIGIPMQCEEELDFDLRLFDGSKAKAALPQRPPYGHKGTFGKMLAVCGSEHYIGAAGICTAAAMRCGVGLAEIFSSPKVIDALAVRMFECIYSRAKADEDGFMVSSNAEEILEKAKGAKCILVGCGLGVTEETKLLVKKIVENADCTLVLDADAVNCIAGDTDILLNKKGEVVLTPHPAELARLCGVPLEEILSHRLKYARAFAEKYSVTVMAKGAETFVVDPRKGYLVRKGNTALSKGGSGDMLAGMTASLIAQGSHPLTGCGLASFIMGAAAEKLSEESSERGILATDIINELPTVLYVLENTDKEW